MSDDPAPGGLKGGFQIVGYVEGAFAGLVEGVDYKLGKPLIPSAP